MTGVIYSKFKSDIFDNLKENTILILAKIKSEYIKACVIPETIHQATVINVIYFIQNTIKKVATCYLAKPGS